MPSFSDLYADAQLCILAFLPVRDLLAMFRTCKSLGVVVARVRVTAGIEITSVRDESTGLYTAPQLPGPDWPLRHLVTDLRCDSMDLLPACAPHTLRERCPSLGTLTLRFRSVDASSLTELLDSEPPTLWPGSLHSLTLSWADAYSQVDSIAGLTAQLRVMLLTAARIHSLTSLSLDATGHFTISEEEENMFRNAAPFPPFLAPLLQLTQLRSLSIDVELQCVDSGCGDTNSRWLCDADCSVLYSLPALAHLNINTGHLSRDGLLPRLIHSAEADGLRRRLRSMAFLDWTAVDPSTASPELFAQLRGACPLMAAALTPTQQ